MQTSLCRTPVEIKFVEEKYINNFQSVVMQIKKKFLNLLFTL